MKTHIDDCWNPLCGNVFFAGKALIVYGARQVGKTTLVRRILSSLPGETGVVSLNGDMPVRTHHAPRTTRRIMGRTDDMLIIRGVNVFPSQIEAALMRVKSVAPHYMIEVMRPGALGEVTVHIEMQPGMFSDSMKEMQAVKASIDAAVASITGLHMHITLVQPNTLNASKANPAASKTCGT